jgi:hypothetical protein
VGLASALAHPSYAQETQGTQPDLNLILDSMERAEAQDPAISRPYEVTREYKLFRGDALKPVSDVTAQISFIPPNNKTFKITDQQGNALGTKIIAAMLEQEAAAAKHGHRSGISRSNYEFIFVREQNFEAVPQYVLHIIPKRKEKGLLLGDIWVDAKTYRTRQIIGVPVTTLSFWIKDLHLTLQFAAVNDMWVLASVDAIATVRFLGLYTLSGVDLTALNAASGTPRP